MDARLSDRYTNGTKVNRLTNAEQTQEEWIKRNGVNLWMNMNIQMIENNKRRLQNERTGLEKLDEKDNMRIRK